MMLENSRTPIALLGKIGDTPRVKKVSLSHLDSN